MYRAIALYFLRKGIDGHDRKLVAAECPNIHVTLEYDEEGKQQVILNGENVTGYIRKEEVCLLYTSRIIVKEGLRRIQHTNITGLQALIEANHLEEKKISSYHFGFILGPCINASGRLTSAKDALELLLCEDKELCRQKAEALTQLNAERKEMKMCIRDRTCCWYLR